MTVQYFVTAVSTCDQCNGAGYVQDAQWKRFFEQHGAEYSKASVEDGETMLCDFFGISTLRHLPTEEHLCADCNGTGSITKQVSLAEALAVLKEVQP